MIALPQLYYKENNTWAEYYGSMPIGSVYMSYESTSPATIYGGTWTRITSAVIRGNSGSTTGYQGNDNVTLTVDQIPSHSHKISFSSLKVNVDIGASGYSDYFRGGPPSALQPFQGTINATITNTGGGEAFSVLPRRFEVYIWYRTA